MKHAHHHGGCADACCLRVADLSVRLGNETILEHVNLHMHCGQMVALIGPNGAGKTTASYSLLPEMLDCREFVNSDEFAKGLSPFDPSKASTRQADTC